MDTASRPPWKIQTPFIAHWKSQFPKMRWWGTSRVHFHRQRVPCLPQTRVQQALDIVAITIHTHSITMVTAVMRQVENQWAALLAGANIEIKYLFNPNLLGRVRVALIFIISTLIFSRHTGIQRTVDIRHWQWVWETSVQLRSTDCSIDNSSTRQTVDAIRNLFLHFQKLSLLSYRSEQRMAEQVRDDDAYVQIADY